MRHASLIMRTDDHHDYPSILNVAYVAYSGSFSPGAPTREVTPLKKGV